MSAAGPPFHHSHPGRRPAPARAAAGVAHRRHRSVVALVVATLSVVAAACGDDAPQTADTSADRSAVPPTRPAGGVPQPTGPNPEDSTVPPRETPAERSQPWWKPVTTFRGDANVTTEAFEIEGEALQWRARWKCESGTLTAVPVKQPGGPGRPLASRAACSGTEGSGFSTQTGRFAIQVTAAGPWELTVEQQVDHPLVEDAMPEMAQATVVSTATLYNVDRTVKGTARVYRLPDGRHAIRLEDFFVTANIDLEIRLSELPEPKSTDEVVSAPFVDVAFLKATVGSMNYVVPPEIDPARFQSIVIWCDITHNAYGAGRLQS